MVRIERLVCYNEPFIPSQKCLDKLPSTIFAAVFVDLEDTKLKNKIWFDVSGYDVVHHRNDILLPNLFFGINEDDQMYAEFNVFYSNGRSFFPIIGDNVDRYGIKNLTSSNQDSLLEILKTIDIAQASPTFHDYIYNTELLK